LADSIWTLFRGISSADPMTAVKSTIRLICVFLAAYWRATTAIPASIIGNSPTMFGPSGTRNGEARSAREANHRMGM
jgi:hypothetical protein